MAKYIATATLKVECEADSTSDALAHIAGVTNQFGNFPPTVSVSYSADEVAPDAANIDTTEAKQPEEAAA
jgi:hypothetical protein